jgi:hypothetical protein
MCLFYFYYNDKRTLVYSVENYLKNNLMIDLYSYLKHDETIFSANYSSFSSIMSLLLHNCCLLLFVKIAVKFKCNFVTACQSMSTFVVILDGNTRKKVYFNITSFIAMELLTVELSNIKLYVSILMLRNILYTDEFLSS